MFARSSQPDFSPPAVDREFIESLEFTREPQTLFARYFLAADRALAEQGVYLRRKSFAELKRLHDLHQSTRNPMLAVLDNDFAAIPEDSSVCLIAYDHQHSVIATIAARVMDLGPQSAKETMEDLTFWFGDRAPDYRHRSICHVGVPEAENIRGRLLYMGGMWTHPDRRRSQLAIIITRLLRIYSHCVFDFDYEIGMAQAKFAREDVRERYAFANCEHGFWWDTDGVRNIDGVLMWSPAPYLAELAELSLREWGLEPRPSVHAAGSQHAVQTASLRYGQG